MSDDLPFVPDDFDVPTTLEGPGFRLEPLGPEHAERDHEAWMTSIDHIRATPGMDVWAGEWPRPMGLEENRQDLVRHAEDFVARRGFTYTILAGQEVVGCCYLYPSPLPDHDVRVLSWVRATRAELDPVVWKTISDWLVEVWPFRRPEYARRG